MIWAKSFSPVASPSGSAKGVDDLANSSATRTIDDIDLIVFSVAAIKLSSTPSDNPTER